MPQRLTASDDRGIVRSGWLSAGADTADRLGMSIEGVATKLHFSGLSRWAVRWAPGRDAVYNLIDTERSRHSGFGSPLSCRPPLIGHCRYGWIGGPRAGSVRGRRACVRVLTHGDSVDRRSTIFRRRVHPACSAVGLGVCVCVSAMRGSD